VTLLLSRGARQWSENVAARTNAAIPPLALIGAKFYHLDGSRLEDLEGDRGSEQTSLLRPPSLLSRAASRVSTLRSGDQERTAWYWKSEYSHLPKILYQSRTQTVLPFVGRVVTRTDRLVPREPLSR
jgi:hypothetical protein